MRTHKQTNSSVSLQQADDGGVESQLTEQKPDRRSAVRLNVHAKTIPA